MNPQFNSADGASELLRHALTKPVAQRGNGARENDSHYPEPEDDSSSAVVPTLCADAYHGALGQLVHELEPFTEASPAGILVSLLVGVGCLIGRGPHQFLDGARHGVNLFALLVGPSSYGRKGTAVARARSVLEALDSDFAHANWRTGLSTGEGLIYHVRDGGPADPRDGTRSATRVDAGVSDKRLLVFEEEFGSALKRKRGRENSLSAVARSAWDGMPLGTLTRGEPLRASNTHVALIAQITPIELRGLIEADDATNGFLNRFIFAYVEATKLLPQNVSPPREILAPLIKRLHDGVRFARTVGEMTLHASADVEWETTYREMSAGGLGIASGLGSRAPAIVRRIAALFAVLDEHAEIGVDHLRAAVAICRYSADSAAYVFRDMQMFSPLARRILAALDQAGAAGLSRTELRNSAVKSNNVTRIQIDRALDELREAGLVRMQREPSRARRREVWRHARHALSLAAPDRVLGELGKLGANGAR